MKNEENVPEIIRKINRVEVQQGPLSHDAGQMQIPDSVEEVPAYLSAMLAQLDASDDEKEN